MQRFIFTAGLGFGLALGTGDSVGAQQTVTLPTADKPLPIEFAPVFTIGTDDGEAWEMFARVIAVAFDAEDNLYVLDQEDPRVVVFDARGNYVRTVGRRGPGPGELQMPTALTVLRDGSIVVGDWDRGAYSIWDRAGKFIRSVQFGSMDAAPTLNGLAGAQQILLVRTHAGRAANQPDGHLPFFRFDLGTGKTTVALRLDPPVDEQQTRVETGAGSATMRRTALPTFSPTPLMAGFSDGTMAASFSFDYVVRIAGSSGERTIQRAITPRKVTTADRNRALRERREALERDGLLSYRLSGGVASRNHRKLSPAEIDQRLNAIQFTSTIPVIHGLIVDGRDVLWIARTPHAGKSTSPIDLVGADGTYIGTIPDAKLPAAVSRTGLAAYIETHGDGYQQIVVKRAG